MHLTIQSFRATHFISSQQFAIAHIPLVCLLETYAPSEEERLNPYLDSLLPASFQTSSASDSRQSSDRSRCVSTYHSTMASINHQSSGRSIVITALVLGCFLATTASAGEVHIQQADTSAGCGRNLCTIPAHALYSQGVYGCTGSQSYAGRAPGSLGYVSYNDVCQGGAFSIDWRITPLRLQFRNSANDFQECLLQSTVGPQTVPPTSPESRTNFFCNMGN